MKPSGPHHCASLPGSLKAANAARGSVGCVCGLQRSRQVAQWWGPEGFTVPTLEFDPVVGASYRIEMQPPDGEPFHLTGEFRAVDPPLRLAFTFVYEEPDPDDVDTLVELSLQDLGESTEVVFKQGPFKRAARRDLHRDGWTEQFPLARAARLQAITSRQPPNPDAGPTLRQATLDRAGRRASEFAWTRQPAVVPRRLPS